MSNFKSLNQIQAKAVLPRSGFHLRVWARAVSIVSFMDELSLADTRSVQAAEGWLGLGDWKEAERELDAIAPEQRTHPDVLRVRWEICAKSKDWEMGAGVARTFTDFFPELPFGWIHLAYSLHELKLTQDAWDTLLPVADKFPEEYVIRYNLACYACQMGRTKEAWHWLSKAMEVGGKKRVRAMALEDTDLKSLWKEIAQA
jgi:hypothetical protein